MGDSFDKRVTPAKPEIAALHLKGKVEAARFVEGQTVTAGIGRISLHAAPSGASEQVSEILYGEAFTIYERGDGWVWGQAERDGYVGYVVGGVLDVFQGPSGPNARIKALMAPVFSQPSIKSAIFDMLPLNAVLNDDIRDGDFVQIGSHAYVHKQHVGPSTDTDFVTVAEHFLGVPYVWGGRTAAGLDCSGLIQTALQAVGKPAPRDTDMMEKALGEKIGAASQRGDLVFWKGHVGVMLDSVRLLHANAYHMLVAIEPLAEAVARIEKIAGPETSARRL
jgi:hypothetical protein